MDNLRRLGNRISVTLSRDDSGFTGRECPQCEGYFKIELGTGLRGTGLPCHCPYCGHVGQHDQFHTKEQIEYAQSVAMHQVADAIVRDLKEMEFDHPPRGAFGIGISMKVEPGSLVPIRYYREKELETETVCASCTLRYSVYGVFAYCPDCGEHNSAQILEKNFDLILKMLDLASRSDADLAERLIENALEDCVSVFDGFGRELCRVSKHRTANPGNVDRLRFQNLQAADVLVFETFGIRLSADLSTDEWELAARGFQKRHLFAHKMGVVDDDYVRKTGEAQAVIGRRILLRADEVRTLVDVVRRIARTLSLHLRGAMVP
jgi:hypothetical protein